MIPDLSALRPEKPVLLAGPTASGKSALALSIAATQGRAVVNADALQVFDAWPILTARPGPEDLERAVHQLYALVPFDSAYSVGQWLRDLDPFLRQTPAPVIVGGTGLYFTALTVGLADIPATDPMIRAEADAKSTEEMLCDLDPATTNHLDIRNPVRVQRAWEVQRQTGRSLSAWQADTGPPRLRLEQCSALHLTANPGWLAERIDRRFDQMVEAGALREAELMEPGWDPGMQSSRAIGAAEMIAVVRGTLTLPDAVTSAKQSSKQYAKRQRTWFRSRMRAWNALSAESLAIRRNSG